MIQFAPTVLKTLEARDRAGLAQLRDYRSLQSLPELWPLAAEHYGDRLALEDPHYTYPARLTYGELAQQIITFATGLQALGVTPGQGIALFADNSHRWLIADQGIMTAGCYNAVRSGIAEAEELRYIADHSDSTAIVFQDLKLWHRLQPPLAGLPLTLGILLTDEAPPADPPFPVVNFPSLMALGQQGSLTPVTQPPDTLATLIYTSGTTGKPKGVMIQHRHLLHQLTTLGAVVQPQPGDRVLGLLPTWHTFGRTTEYFLYSQGCTQTYTNIRAIKADFKAVKPHFMVGVPRLWESIYEGIQKQFREQPASKQRLINTLLWMSQKYIENQRTAQNLSLVHPDTTPLRRFGSQLFSWLFWPGHVLGGKLVYSKVREATGGQVKALVSGGGSLARHIDLFFEILGIPILVGYGLTETSPVLSARRLWRNLRGSAGQPIPGTELCIVDPETRQPLPQGQKGLVLARGPQVMAGYYKDPEATAKAINPEGWFDTGDLGWLTADGNVVLTGRAKDTIVLTNGENIEPQPIEDACGRSPYIDQIMVVGQDQRVLGALIVPNLDALQVWAQEQGYQFLAPGVEASGTAPTLTLEDDRVQKLFRAELNAQVKDRPGYRPDDRIGPFRLLPEPFTMENGALTQTLKIRRPVVAERYRDMINTMFA